MLVLGILVHDVFVVAKSHGHAGTGDDEWVEDQDPAEAAPRLVSAEVQVKATPRKGSNALEDFGFWVADALEMKATPSTTDPYCVSSDLVPLR